MPDPPEFDLAQRMADLARTVARPRSRADVFDEVTGAAVEIIDGVDAAGILLIDDDGQFESHAGTSPLPHELDELQQLLHEGPCLEAALDDLVVRTHDFRHEPRWPAYSAEAVKLGVLSGMSFRLYTTERTAGALNLFGFAPTPWDAEALATGSVLAAHAVAAVLAERQHAHLRSALADRDRVGQAKGVLMERHGVDDVQAFDMLKAYADGGGGALVDIAEQVLGTRGG